MNLGTLAETYSNSWTELAGPNMPAFSGCGLPVICSLAIDTANNLYTQANGEVVKWDGSNWTSIGGNFTFPITGIVADKLGNLYVRSFSLDANGNPFISKWDGTKWTVLGNIPTTTKFSGTCFINHLATDLAGNLYAEGYMTDSNGNRYIAKWDGTKWSELGDISGIIPSSSSGTDGWLASLCTDALGNVYASGNVTAISSSNNTAHYKGCVAKWDGNSWTALGGINDTTFNTVFGASSLVTDAASNLYCYAYQQYDSVNTNNIVKWDGGKWNVLGGSSRRIFDNGDNVIQGMNVDAAGNVYASSDTGTAGKVYFIAELSVTSTLPIKLLSFTAKESGDNVVLNWSATNETNASYYLVQRSIDGTNFTDIDKQDANGTGDYLFVDKGLSNQNATYYYRLEMLDNSGTRTFSKVVSCEWLVASKQLVVYPNPIKDVATI